MTDEFSTKIGKSFWLHLMIIALICGIVMIIARFYVPAVIFAVILFGVLVFYFILVAKRTKYILDEDEIIIKGVVSETKIQYNSVRKIIGNTKNLINYDIVVTSLDRVELFYGKNGRILISPKDKQNFLEKLRSKCYRSIYISIQMIE